MKAMNRFSQLVTGAAIVAASAFAASSATAQQAPQQGQPPHGNPRPALVAPHPMPPPHPAPRDFDQAPPADRPYPGSAGAPVLQADGQLHGQHAGTPTHGELAHDPEGVAEAEADAHGNGDVAHGEHGEHAAPKGINWFDFGNKEQPPFGAMILNFVLLMAMYVALGKKPIAEALKNRRSSIAKEIEEAQKMRKEAEARALIYQEKLLHLEAEVKETREALVEAGKNERDRIVKDAEEKATRLEKDALFLVEQEVKQMRVDLTREAVEIAVAAAEELLKKRVTPVDQERLAEDYLAELTTKTKTSGSIPPSRSMPAAVAPAPQGGQS
jgi:F-type H+-transporting ATPase subunit b